MAQAEAPNGKRPLRHLRPIENVPAGERTAPATPLPKTFGHDPPAASRKDVIRLKPDVAAAEAARAAANPISDEPVSVDFRKPPHDPRGVQLTTLSSAVAGIHSTSWAKSMRGVETLAVRGKNAVGDIIQELDTALLLGSRLSTELQELTQEGVPSAHAPRSQSEEPAPLNVTPETRHSMLAASQTTLTALREGMRDSFMNAADYILALVHIGDTSVVSHLEKFAHDSQVAAVQDLSWWAVHRLNGDKPNLSEALADAKSDNTTQAMIGVIDLELIGSRRSRNALIELSHRTTGIPAVYVRAMSAWALRNHTSGILNRGVRNRLTEMSTNDSNDQVKEIAVESLKGPLQV